MKNLIKKGKLSLPYDENGAYVALLHVPTILCFKKRAVNFFLKRFLLPSGYIKNRRHKLYSKDVKRVEFIFIGEHHKKTDHYENATIQLCI